MRIDISDKLMLHKIQMAAWDDNPPQFANIMQHVKSMIEKRTHVARNVLNEKDEFMREVALRFYEKVEWEMREVLGMIHPPAELLHDKPPLTLQECKDAVAKKYGGYDNWKHFEDNAGSGPYMQTMMDEVAEMYMQSNKGG